jgi:2-oxoglutarate dehydrogenase E2 component (dihydrolipoamide succinyltransferase)
MSANVTVPRLAESISEAVLVEWLREDGATVRADEPVAVLETDKAAVEIAAPEAGVIRHRRKVGDKVQVGDELASLDPAPAGAASAAPAKAPAKPAAPPAPAKPAAPSAAPAPVATKAPAPVAAPAPSAPRSNGGGEPALSPAVRRLVEEHGLEPSSIPGTGPGGRLLKEDVLRHIEAGPTREGAKPATAPSAAPAGKDGERAEPSKGERAELSKGEPAEPLEDERVVPMSRIRQRIAERLVRAQHTAAILTTFNEIDMSAMLDLRARYKDNFEKRHGVRLGFMSFFTRAVVLALEQVPEINAEIRGTDIVYRRRVHMGIAVGTERGLVVPVVRDAHRRSFAEIEKEIERLAGKARDGTLTLDELSGGTFTISNGGVYGSLLSTPILNPPQSGILGMHKIEKRPVVVNDQVVVRPMMYVALSYDHRIVDGEQAVTFLVRVKERLEDPGRMMLDV